MTNCFDGKPNTLITNQLVIMVTEDFAKTVLFVE